MFITTLLILVVLAAILGVLWTVHRQDELDERQEELDKYSTHLDERANILAADEATCREMNLMLREELKKKRIDAITWQDIQLIVRISDDLLARDQSTEMLLSEFQSEQSYYEEILKRFNAQKDGVRQMRRIQR